MAKRRLTRVSSPTAKRRSRFAWKTWAILGVLGVALAGIVAYMIVQAPGEAAKVGKAAPDFTLRLLNGQKIALSSLRGRPVLVDFWSSTWPHCQREAPVLAKIYAKYHDKGFELLSVNVSWDNDASARKFVEEHGLPFPVGRDSDAVIGTQYNVDATPANFFIDKNGVLVEQKTGSFEGDLESEFSRRVEKLLGQ